LLSPLLLVGIPVGVILLAMIFGYFLPSFKRRRMRSSPIAIAPFGRDTKAVVPPRPERPPTPPASAPVAASPFAPPVPPVEPVVLDRSALSVDANPVEARAARAADAEDLGRVLKLQVAGDPRHAVREPSPSPASTLRLEKPVDGTLQFLPGKLEVVEGRDVGQEIRFVRTAGPDGQTITFGRSEGPQYRHIQLQEHTVSRQHAKMVLDGKTWTLTNMSRTNPVSVNGLAMSEETPSVVLRDGDRIEMGEVVFRFRSR
jgi:hypothetical protein